MRAFHRFTLVDQSARGRDSRDLTKGRRRDQGAVKISCARQVGPCCVGLNAALQVWGLGCRGLTQNRLNTEGSRQAAGVVSILDGGSWPQAGWDSSPGLAQPSASAVSMAYLSAAEQQPAPCLRPRACLQGVQDPNARNCHGYRKFVKRTVLENPSYGYLVNDTIVIRYTIELVISSGGALSRTPGAAAIPRPPAIQVLPLCCQHGTSSSSSSGLCADTRLRIWGWRGCTCLLHRL